MPGEADGHQGIVLVVTEGEPAPEVPALQPDPWPGDGRFGEGVAIGDDELRTPGVSAVTADPDAPCPEGDGQGLRAFGKVFCGESR